MTNLSQSSGVTGSSKVITRKIYPLLQNQDNKIVSLIIKGGIAYIPTISENPYALNFWTTPIYQVPVTDVKKIFETTQKILNQKKQDLVDREDAELFKAGQKGLHPIQLATKSKSWADLESNSRIYSIQILDDQRKWRVTLDNPLTKDVYNSRDFEIKRPLEEIVKIILEDAEKKYLFQSSTYGVRKQSSIEVVFVNGKVFFPTRVLTHDNVWLIDNPVYTSSNDLKAVSAMIKEIRSMDREVIEDERALKILKRRSNEPMLKATKISSNKKFMPVMAWYSISWSELMQEISLYLYEPDPKKKVREITFNYETPIEDLIKIILEDVKKYPKVLKLNSGTDL